MELTLGSLFDGISGFPLAGARLGIKTLWGSEIEPFPIKVSEIRFPDMKQLGDITKINGAEIEPVDIVTGGSPCQDLSVAGKRAGLAGERSGLFMEMIRVVKEMRERDRKAGKPIRPRFMVWENVPGAFSSNDGEDFRAVLEETARIADETVTIPRPPGGAWNTCGAIMADGWSIAWRVLDAQYWGVPQRRRRIFLVADFGGQSAPEILFKRPGLSRHIAQGEEAGEGVAANAEGGVGKAILFEPRSQDGVPRLHGGVVPTLNTAQGGQRQPCVCLQGSMIGRADKNGPQGDGINENVSFTLNTTDRHAVAFACNQRDEVRDMKDKSGALQAQPGMKQQTFIATKVYGIGAFNSEGMKSDNPHSGIYEAETSRTIDLNGGSPACNQGGMAIVQCIEPGALSRGQAIAQINCQPGVVDEVAKPLSAQPQLRHREDMDTLITQHYSVRRLTPLECERLQGFPDFWTDIPGQTEATQEELEFWRDVWLTWDKTQAEDSEKVKPRTDKSILKWLKNPTSDSAQYKALGNSVAVPCVEYVLEGIKSII